MKTCPLCKKSYAERARHFCSVKCALHAARIARGAYSAVYLAIRDGRLQRIDESVACVDCGNPAKEYDHRDYTKPLNVVPVCGSCNAKRGTADVYLLPA